MIKGFEVFKNHFAGYEDEYVIIGGAACDIISTDLGLDFRATKDFDLVLIVEALTKNFIDDFWKFIREGGYENRTKLNDTPELFRFQKPRDSSYPYMIELFSKKSDILKNAEVHIGPIELGEEIVSLSAILLDDDYYDVLLSGREMMMGVPILKTEFIIVFKCKAYIDMVSKKETGEQISSKEIRKHRNDVFRLMTYLPGEKRVVVNDIIRKDLVIFIEAMANEDIDTDNLGLKSFSKEKLVNLFKAIYGIG